jgi:hypothetical protein
MSFLVFKHEREKDDGTGYLELEGVGLITPGEPCTFFLCIPLFFVELQLFAK